VRRVALVLAAAVCLAVAASLVALAVRPPGHPGREPRRAPASAALASSGGTAAPQAQVLAISVDGLTPAALTRLGRDRTPALHRMVRQGATTLNARSEVERTETLPNHTGMVTGLRVRAARGGHGVTWNDERTDPATVQDAAGRAVDSVFALAHRHGLATALYVTKPKLALFARSWPAQIDTVLVDERNRAAAAAARRDLVAGGYAFALLHLSAPDLLGHAHGWLSRPYLRAVRRSDRLVGRILDEVRAAKDLRRRVTVILTADHGGGRARRHHDDPRRPADFRVPFLMWGAGVDRGADLYALSPGLAEPGDARVGYRGRQPVRNGFVANAAAELLGLPVVRGSELDADRLLRWAAP
jgi:hypothetical protein